MTYWSVFAFSFGALGISLMCLIYGAQATGSSAMSFGLVSGSYVFLGMLATLVGSSLRSLHQRIKLLEQKQNASDKTP
jgi:hypothetical protein